jgi:hypothetical protein
MFEMHDNTQNVKLMLYSRTESFKIGQCQQYDVVMWTSHVCKPLHIVAFRLRVLMIRSFHATFKKWKNDAVAFYGFCFSLFFIIHCAFRL